MLLFFLFHLNKLSQVTKRRREHSHGDKVVSRILCSKAAAAAAENLPSWTENGSSAREVGCLAAVAVVAIPKLTNVATFMFYPFGNS